MTTETIQESRWLRSRPAPGGFSPDKIDAEKGILYDVVMVEEGEAKGHGVRLEAEFVRDLVAYDNATFANRGLKARFGHPSASNDTMGTQLGVFYNFRTRRDKGRMQAIADLHLLDSSEESPTHPGMRSWVLKMASERPDFLMMSIVFRQGALYQKKANGHKVYIGNEYDADPDLGDVFVEFGTDGQHFYTDLVEEGAATESLFGTQMNPDFFVSRAHRWLDENPDILDFVQKNPQRVQFFLMRLGISIQQPQQKKMSTFSIKKWLFGEEQDATPTAEDLDTLKAELSAAKEAYTALEAEKQALENRVQELGSKVDALQTNVNALKSEAETLRADASAKADEITRLKSEPATTHTGAPTAPADPEGNKRLYGQDPVSQRAQKIREARRQNV